MPSVKIENLIRPFSSGFAAVSARQQTELLTKRFVSEIEKEIEVKCWKEKNDYFIWSQIPSKANAKYPGDRITYDVIIKLSPPNSAWIKQDHMREYDVKVFSNEPNFMFTFTYAFSARRGLLNMPNGYYSRKALKIKPKVRNPLLLLGIDEGLFFTVMYMDKNHLFVKARFEERCNDNKLTLKDVQKLVVGQEEKYKENSNRQLRHRNEQKKKDIVKFSRSEEEQLASRMKQETNKVGKAKSPEFLRSRLTDTDLYSDLSSSLKYNQMKDSTEQKRTRALEQVGGLEASLGNTRLAGSSLGKTRLAGTLGKTKLAGKR